MDAPAISTLTEEPTPPPSSPTIHISRFRVEPPTEPQTIDTTSIPGRSRPDPGDSSLNQEVYVLGDEEEDQLIDEDETGAIPPSVGGIHQSTPAPSVQTPATSISGTPASARLKKPAKNAVTSGVSATSAPKRGRKTKAILEVERQEDPSMSMMSAWRVEVPGIPPVVAPTPEEVVQPPKPGPKRKRTATKGETNPPGVLGSTAPARKRIRKSAAKLEENTSKEDPSHFSIQVSSFSESSYVPIQIDPPSSQPLAFPAHVECFILPDNGILNEVPTAALASAPLHVPLVHTAAIQPANTLPWQAYLGPLEKEGMKCRRWNVKQREIRSIGGVSWFTRTWIGGNTTEMHYVRPPPPPLVVEINPKLVTPAIAAKPRKSKGNKDVPTPIKPSAPPTSIVTAVRPGENDMVDAAMELEMLVG